MSNDNKPAAALVEIPESVLDAVAAAIGSGVYYCNRTWSAWNYGTMGPGDFHLVADDGDHVAEIAQAAIAAMQEHAPVAAAPVDGDFDGASYKRMFIDACSALAEVSRELGVDPEQGGAEPILAAIAKLKASTPAAPGIDLGQIWERAHADMLARRRRNKHDCFVLRCLKDSVDALVVEQIDASPKGDVHADDLAVDAFAAAMKSKLAAARAKGRGGWDGDEPGMQQRLSDMLRDHVEKGDPRDVANFCMFLHQRGEGISPKGGSDALVRELVDADIAYDAAEQALVAHDKPTLRRDADWHLEQERLDAIADAAIERRAAALAALQATSAEVSE